MGFSRLKGVQQDKSLKESRNYGEHAEAEKRDLKFFTYGQPEKDSIYQNVVQHDPKHRISGKSGYGSHFSSFRANGFRVKLIEILGRISILSAISICGKS